MLLLAIPMMIAIYFICDPASAGTDSRCDNASDWTRPFDNTAGSYETSYSSLQFIMVICMLAEG